MQTRWDPKLARYTWFEENRDSRDHEEELQA